jgi:phenylacetaldehyde dehydrogenase
VLNPDKNAAVQKNEVFGPVVTITRFSDTQDAVDLANNSEFGLAASVWGNDLGTVMNLLPKVRAGTVWVNGHVPVDPSMPFGGMKQSGIGREFGTAALDAFTELKSVCIAH